MRQVFTLLALVGAASAISLSKQKKGGERSEPTDQQKSAKASFMEHCTGEGYSEEDCNWAFRPFMKFMRECVEQGGDRVTCLADAEAHLQALAAEQQAPEGGDSTERQGDRPEPTDEQKDAKA